MAEHSSDIQFRYIDLTRSLIQEVLHQTAPGADTVYVFPTEKSRLQAIREFQKGWQFTRTLFITMEEFKSRLFTSPFPLLREEKRTLAFYRALDAEDRAFFNILSYFQSIQFAQDFFDLFQEFNEERVEERIQLSAPKLTELGVHEWQIETFGRLLEIRDRYAKLLQSLRYADPIFVFKDENYDDHAFSGYRRFVFVNQFYYTGLEKEVINRLRNKGQVLIYYQAPAYLVDEQSLEVKSFSFQSLGHSRLQNLSVVECPNEFSQIAALLNQLEPGMVVYDAGTGQSGYDSFLSFEHFDTGNNFLLRKTFLYQFFSILHNLLNESIFEPKRKKRLVPLNRIMPALANDRFIQLLKDRSGAEKISSEAVFYEGYDLLDNGFRYVDWDLEVFQHTRAPQLQTLMGALFSMLTSFRRVSSPQELVDLIDSERGVDVLSLLSQEETNYSDLSDVFYQKLYDFKSLDEAGILSDWHLLEPSRNEVAGGLGAAILRLFLDYLRPVRFQYDLSAPQSPRVRITSLLDSRNIRNESVAVLNAIEGKLPHARQTPFLFTDNQRALLGLKTYEDVRLREKYYFYRLLLNSRSAVIFTQRNIEQNIEPSSFLEEIKLARGQGSLNFRKENDISYRTLYGDLVQPDKNYTVTADLARDPGFYRIPLGGQKELESLASLSYYSLSQLLKNPFSFYISSVTGVREQVKDDSPGLHPQLIGNIVHEAMNRVWRLFEEEAAAAMLGYDFSQISDDQIARACKFAEELPGSLYFQIPHDFSYVYFSRFILPRMKESIAAFFSYLLNSPLQGKRLRVIPEAEYSTGVEKISKILVSAAENALNIDLGIRGRADLRIENMDEPGYYIYDYKTGNMEEEQLIFYELFYYLLDSPEMEKMMHSAFYDFFEKTVKPLEYFNRKLSREWRIEQFRQKVIAALNRLAEQGFAMPDKKTDMGKLGDISRKDLYLMMGKQQT